MYKRQIMCQEVSAECQDVAWIGSLILDLSGAGGELVTNGYRWLPMVTVPRRMVTVLGLRVVACDRAFLHLVTAINGDIRKSKRK